MKSLLITLTLTLVCFSSFAQTSEPSSGIEKNNLQIELESLFTRQREASELIKTWSIPSVLIRYGLFNGVELQFNTPVVKEKLYENDHLIHSLHKFDDSQIGLSIDLWKQHKFLPEAAIMTRLILPTKLDLRKEHFGKVVSLNLSHQINDKLSFTYNIGCVNETSNVSSGFYIYNINYDLNEKFHLFIEEFADFGSHQTAFHNMNFGFGFAINDKLGLDLSTAKGINHDMFYVGGILFYKFNLKSN